MFWISFALFSQSHGEMGVLGDLRGASHRQKNA
jgi:hypothetical protein